LLFVIVMLGGLLWNYPAFIALFALIHFGAWYELVKLLKRIHPNHYLLYCLVGLLYISLPILMMIDLRSEGNFFNGNLNSTTNGRIIPCAILFSIWINDTMAYLVGSMIGKTPFTKISPKKTWEGTIGGIILCMLTIALAAHFSKLVPVEDAVNISAILGML